MMTTVREITDLIEAFAPLSYQESYDNAGLIVGRGDCEVKGVVLAVDVTEEVLNEALSVGANMVITHHPIVFKGMKRFNSVGYVERCVEFAIRNDLIIYACHTNLDSTPDGMSWRLARNLGLENITLLESSRPVADVGFGVVGEFANTLTEEEALNAISDRLDVKAMRHSRLLDRPIKKVALCTGSGGSLMDSVRRSGAQLYVTADLRYNDFMEPSTDYIVVDIGHFESEYCAIDILFDILSKKMFNFAVRKSESSCNPVFYRGF